MYESVASFRTTSARWLVAGFLAVFAYAGSVSAQSAGPDRAGQRSAVPDDVRAAELEAPVDWELWSGGRYRITPGDVIQLDFPYVPEFDQTVSVQPDGYVSLKAIRDVYARGLTVPQFERAVTDAYGRVLREPVVSVALKEFEKPYFIAAGQVARPGKFDLRGATTVTQALALAGGATKTAKSSQVIVFRRFSDEYLEVKTINVKKMFRSRDLSEDVILRPGDTVFVPTTTLSKLGAFIPSPSLGLFLDPLSILR